MNRAGTSVEKPTPGPVMATTRSKIFREICPRMMTALRVMGWRREQ
jgi:hypothetical protein